MFSHYRKTIYVFLLSRKVEKVYGLSVSFRPSFSLSVSVGATLKRMDVETDMTNLIGVFRYLCRRI